MFTDMTTLWRLNDQLTIDDK